MPLYEYACRKCGHAFEALQKGSDGPLRKCPECGALQLKKLVSAPSFHLKGGGWYETDFKNAKRGQLTESGDDKPPAADGAGAGKDKDEKAAKKDKADTTDKTDKKDKAEKKPEAAKPATPAAE